MNTNHLTIHPDGTVTAHLEPDVALSWPTVAEWNTIVAAYDDADATEGRGRYSRAFAVVIATLSNVAQPDPERLPLWTDDASIPRQLAEVWLGARVETAEEPLPDELTTFTPIPDDDETVNGGG